MATRKTEPATLALAALLGAATLSAACSRSHAATPESESAAPAPSGDHPARQAPAVQALPEDAPLGEHRRALLELAFDAASAMPLEPHVKNRARSQEEVVEACLELDQARLALRFLDGIPNWRRGLAYASLAYWCAQRGVTDPVEGYLAVASEAADEVLEDELGQEWRADRIRARIAATYTALGRPEDAQRFAAGVLDSEAGAVHAAEALFLDEEDLEARVAAMQHAARVGSFEHMQNALMACVPLYERFYEDAARRQRVEQAIRDGWEKLPYQLRIEVLGDLARVEIEHGNRPRALELVAEARGFLDTVGWMPEDRVAMMATLAELAFAAGDQEKARSEVDAALAIYAQERAAIVDIFRAGALRPVAEAYLVMGDGAKALAVYSRALEESVHNPNSRPRAQDLVSTACSMALHGAEPHDELWARLRAVRAGFADPW